MDDLTYEGILKLTVDEATHMVNNGYDLRHPDVDEDTFHDLLFANVLDQADKSGLGEDVEAEEISKICGEVEWDIVHSDILGL
jgi:hypothetical protein